MGHKTKNDRHGKNTKLKKKEKRNHSGKQASRIREQTRVEDIIVEVKNKWTWAGHVARRNDNQWATRVTTEWIPRGGAKREGQIRKFGGREWILEVQDRSGWRSEGKAFILQWT